MTEGNFPKSNGDIWYDTDVHHAAGIVLIEAGENITAGNIVYIHLTSGKIYVSDTGTANDVRASGVALQTKTTGQDVYVMTRGVYQTAGLTDKEDYYLGASGAISTVRSAVRIGTALSTTQLFVNITQDDQASIGTVKGWHKTFTNTPALSAFWVECDGSVLSDVESPYNSQTIPNINGSGRFLRGDTTSGGTGGATTHTHTINDNETFGAGPTAGCESQTTSEGSSLPSYIDVVWIIKIK